jgi:hypothetical protein
MSRRCGKVAIAPMHAQVHTDNKQNLNIGPKKTFPVFPISREWESVDSRDAGADCQGGEATIFCLIRPSLELWTGPPAPRGGGLYLACTMSIFSMCVPACCSHIRACAWVVSIHVSLLHISAMYLD